MRHALLACLVATCCVPGTALADAVVPSERVESRVVVRRDPSRSAPEVGSLRPGTRGELLSSVGGWHRVRLPDGSEGFVASAWTRVIAAPAAQPERAELGASLRQWLRSARGLLGGRPEVEFVLEDPARDGALHRHDDARLPVAGFASAAGSKGTYDIVLVLDASTSTNEFAETDVDGDGRLRDEWKGPDSIFQAEIRAAREFVHALQRLPGNRDGQRIHVGVVRFAGDERHDAAVEDRELELTPGNLTRLALRDAELRIPLTGDYAALDAELRRLSSTPPSGMTDFAAGTARALMALGVLAAAELPSAPSRPDAEKRIFFLSDGKPRLPYDRAVAERAALYAARLAEEAGVRIHAFALGRDVVTRTVNPVLEGMARRTHGSLVELREPGAIVGLLHSTSFSWVREVQLVNRTRGEASDSIATGIDGSFFGEVPLVEGPNEIEVIAVLNDGRRASERIRVTYEDAAARRELIEKLARIRRENEALLEKLRQDLVHEMETTRKSVSVTADQAPD